MSKSPLEIFVDRSRLSSEQESQQEKRRKNRDDRNDQQPSVPDLSLEAQRIFSPKEWDLKRLLRIFCVVIAMIALAAIIDKTFGPLFPDDLYCELGAGQRYHESARIVPGARRFGGGCDGCVVEWTLNQATTSCIHGTLLDPVLRALTISGSGTTAPSTHSTEMPYSSPLPQETAKPTGTPKWPTQAEQEQENCRKVLIDVARKRSIKFPVRADIARTALSCEARGFAITPADLSRIRSGTR